MRIIAIDPGCTESAVVVYGSTTGRLFRAAKVPNDDVFVILYDEAKDDNTRMSVLVIERIASYGMAVGAEVFETVWWSGRFAQAWLGIGGHADRLYRRDVKLHLCGSPRANDSNIRQALIDLWGGKDKAIGKKATPGPLYGITKDRWQALAVALTYADGVRSKA